MAARSARPAGRNSECVLTSGEFAEAMSGIGGAAMAQVNSAVSRQLSFPSAPQPPRAASALAQASQPSASAPQHYFSPDTRFGAAFPAPIGGPALAPYGAFAGQPAVPCLAQQQRVEAPALSATPYASAGVPRYSTAAAPQSGPLYSSVSQHQVFAGHCAAAPQPSAVHSAALQRHSGAYSAAQYQQYQPSFPVASAPQGVGSGVSTSWQHQHQLGGLGGGAYFVSASPSGSRPGASYYSSCASAPEEGLGGAYYAAPQPRAVAPSAALRVSPPPPPPPPQQQQQQHQPALAAVPCVLPPASTPLEQLRPQHRAFAYQSSTPAQPFSSMRRGSPPPLLQAVPARTSATPSTAPPRRLVGAAAPAYSSVSPPASSAPCFAVHRPSESALSSALRASTAASALHGSPVFSASAPHYIHGLLGAASAQSSSAPPGRESRSGAASSPGAVYQWSRPSSSVTRPRTPPAGVSSGAPHHPHVPSAASALGHGCYGWPTVPPFSATPAAFAPLPGAPHRGPGAPPAGAPVSAPRWDPMPPDHPGAGDTLLPTLCASLGPLHPPPCALGDALPTLSVPWDCGLYPAQQGHCAVGRPKAPDDRLYCGPPDTQPATLETTLPAVTPIPWAFGSATPGFQYAVPRRTSCTSARSGGFQAPADYPSARSVSPGPCRQACPGAVLPMGNSIYISPSLFEYPVKATERNA